MLAVVLTLGCQGSRVAKAPSGPEVSVEVEPLRAGSAASAPPPPSRAQRIVEVARPSPTSSPYVGPSQAAEVRESRRSEDDQERSRRRRRRVRRDQESQERLENRSREVAKPKQDKNFDDLSPEERRRIIEGGL